MLVMLWFLLFNDHIKLVILTKQVFVSPIIFIGGTFILFDACIDKLQTKFKKKHISCSQEFLSRVLACFNL